MDLNKVQLIGRLTGDPEIRVTPSGQNVATFSMATNRSWKDASGAAQEQAEFHNIVAWGKLAEIIGQMLKKGKRAYIEGRLSTRSWEDASGVKKYKTEIVAENMIALDPRDGGGYSSNEPVLDRAPAADDAPRAKSSNDEISIEDVPF